MHSYTETEVNLAAEVRALLALTMRLSNASSPKQNPLAAAHALKWATRATANSGHTAVDEWLTLFLERRHPVDVSVRAVALEAALSRLSTLGATSDTKGQRVVAASITRILGSPYDEETYAPEAERWDEKAYLLALVRRACERDESAAEVCAKAFDAIGGAALNYAVLPGDTHSGVFHNILASSDWLLRQPFPAIGVAAPSWPHLSLPFELHYQGLEGGLTKRSQFDVRLTTGRSAHSPALPLLSLALSADGLSALLGDETSSQRDSTVQQDATGGMALVVLGASLRPYNFFR